MGFAYAATSISGTLTTNATLTEAQSPFVLDGDVSVSNGAVLTVEPGVVIRMNPGANLTVSQGALRARGLKAKPIVITSSNEIPGGKPSPGDWGQVVFLNQTNDAETILEWVEIRYGKGLRIEEALPTLNYVTLENHAGPAIAMDLKSSPSGVGLQASGNTVNGISIPAGDIAGSVQWRLLGIPYVVAPGELSVGAKPTIAGISPNAIQQGQTVDVVLSGTRLSGLENIRFDNGSLSGEIRPGATDTSAPLRLTAASGMPLGNVAFEAQTAAGLVRYETGISVISPKPSLVVSSLTPTNIRRMATGSFTIAGNYLQGAQISVPAGSGLTLGNLQTTESQATFTLTASGSAILGAQAITVSNPTVANGSASASLTVNRALPKVSVSPSPLAVPPDGSVRAFLLRLTDVDDFPHTVNLSVGDPTIAGISPAAVTIPAGSSQASFSVSGLKQGYTVLSISSPTLAAASDSIYVTNVVSGATVGPLVSAPVTVQRQSGPLSLPVGTALGPLLSLPVGVDRRVVANALPTGSVLGPINSAPVGVQRVGALGNTLPAGSVLGPVASAPVGIDRRGASAALPAGSMVGPLISVPVGVTR